MKTPLLWLRLLSLSTFYFLLPTSSFAQGSLTPPPGAPAPTMKSLDQIASTGIAINATNTTGDVVTEFNITQPGSYYLTGNLVGTKNYGIIVSAANVTIDLNGFQISRSSSGGIYAVSIASTAHGCTVKNGSISGFSQGVNAAATRGGTLSQLSVMGTTNSGLVVGGGWEIDGCKVHDCSGTGSGISTSSGCTLRDCTIFNITGAGVAAIAVGTGSTLVNCTAYFNATSAGISALDGCSLLNCAVAGITGNAGITCNRSCTLTNCTAIESDVVAGISAGPGCALNNCVAHLNTSSAASSYGIRAVFGQVSLVNCVAYNNQTSGTPSSDTGVGIFAGDDSSVKDSVAQGNYGDGIQLGSHCQITGSLSSGNGTAPNGSGIFGGSDTTVATCTVQGNKNNGIQVVDRCQIIGCNSNGNGNGTTGSGIVAGLRTLVKNCNASENQKNGIVVLGASVVSENNVGHNGLGAAAAGIDSNVSGSGSGSRIEANIVRNNIGTGILGASNDLIIRNYSFSNGTNYNPTTGTNIGPNGAGVNASTATSPWANF